MEYHVRKHLEEPESEPCKTKGQPNEGKPCNTIKENVIYQRKFDTPENRQLTVIAWRKQSALQTPWKPITINWRKCHV